MHDILSGAHAAYGAVNVDELFFLWEDMCLNDCFLEEMIYILYFAIYMKESSPRRRVASCRRDDFKIGY